MPTPIVVAGALIRRAAVLVAQRVRPPELAGRWGCPGAGSRRVNRAGRAGPPLAEELGLTVGDVAVGDRLGDDIALDGMTLRAYRVELISGEPHARDRPAVRWVTAAELPDVDWVPADRGWVADLARTLAESAS